jgi:hypothetical protein
MNIMNEIFYFFKPQSTAKRICSKCKKPIKAKHKWHFVKNRTQHKDCGNPELKPINISINDLPLFRNTPHIMSFPKGADNGTLGPND